MIVILAYWLLLFFLILPFGYITAKALKIKTDSTLILQLLGLFLLSFSFTISALLIPLNVYHFICYFLFSIVLHLLYCKPICALLNQFILDLKNLTLFYKIILLLLVAGAALKSAQLPFIIDNESYYIQTIKWVNTYGLVKGLGNLHLFFAQASPWHILQAGLNLNFLPITFNDLNGFIFIICSIYGYYRANINNGWRYYLYCQ